jgi:hypothetical protein
LLPIVQEDGWDPGPVWVGAENLTFSGIRFLDRPPRSEPLYELHYPFLSQSIREVGSVAPGDEIVVKMFCCSKDVYRSMGCKTQTGCYVVHIHKA